MDELTIGQAARRAGLRTSALRYYDDAGILPPARRVNGQRRYSEELLDLVRVARFAQSVGFSLSEVRALLSGLEGRSLLRAHWRPMALAKLKQLDAVIAKARHMKRAIQYGLDCGCIRIQDCLPSAAKVSRRASGRGGAAQRLQSPGRSIPRRRPRR
jgi:MerR family redox-sensitive transcriptional activator SoxR